MSDGDNMEPLRFPDSARTIRSKAFSLINERSFFRSKITLASGKESDFYFDMKPTMFHPEGASLLAEMVFERLKTENIDYVGGLAVGAVPLLSPLNALSFMRGHPIPGFFVRQSVKDHGTKKTVEGLTNDSDLQGKAVAILDDVTTTGGSAMIAVRAARNLGAKVVIVLSIVDREEGATESFKTEGVAFEALFTAGEFLRG
jgi:orotate phosphoribosyltransferase